MKFKGRTNLMEKQNNVSKTSRRRFIQRSAIGATILSLPAKSVWANGITNSIVASGHGSDWASGQNISLENPWFWKNNLTQAELSETFSAVFGGDAIKRNGSKHDSGVTLFDILDVLNTKGEDRSGAQKDLVGKKGYNIFMIAMYLNAKYGKSDVNQYNIYYPVANGRPFMDEYEFASHLYSVTNATYQSSAQELKQIIKQDHNYVI